jgi:6-pyruvoyltetrahydropterin/6-carboxytetrahydropterin synthase
MLLHKWLSMKKVEGTQLYSIKVKHPKMSFSSAHFVISEGECEALHGHNYEVEVQVEGDLDELGMVMDFRRVKRSVSKICKNLDHKVLLPGLSSTISVLEEDESVTVEVEGKRYVFPTEDCVILPIISTTAELLASFIYSQLDFTAKFKTSVFVSESGGSVAFYTNED